MYKIIKTDIEYEKALKDVEALIDLDPAPGTDEGDRLELLTLLIANYEEEHFPLELPDPIEAIKFRMEQQELSQRDLIPYIGSRSKVSEVLSGKRLLSLSMIRALNKELSIPAEVLLREPGATIPAEVSDLDWCRFPIKEMVKRNWFQNFSGTPSEALDRAEELLRDFLRPAGLDSLTSQALYRQNVRMGSKMDNYTLLAWRARVLRLALDKSLSISYKPGTICPDFLRELVKLSYFDEGPKLAREFFKKNGFHMIIVPHLSRTHLDGAAMSLQNGTPVVALTLRYDRIDNFWFCLCHELAHIALHFGQFDCFIDDLDASGNELENQADEMARDALIPRDAWEKAPHNHTEHNIRSFADKLRIHPAIVAGRIRWEKNSYRILSRMVGHKGIRKMFPEEMAM
jgi:HTH-type transcriptional regulator/antitoxin HigA